MPARFIRARSRAIIDETTVRHCAEAVVQRVAPDESAFFPEISTAYFADPEGVDKGGARSGRPLRFGAEDLVDLVSLVALQAVSAVVEYVVTEVLEGMKPAARLKALRRLFRVGRELPQGDGDAEAEKPPVSLTPEQLTQVRRVAIEAAKRHRTSEEKAERIANAIVAGLLPDEGEKR